MVTSILQEDNFSPLENRIFRLYDLIWKLALPFLKFNRRLLDGYDQRLFISSLPPPVDIWFQAASVGEAILTTDLLKQLHTGKKITVLVTTNTLQGKTLIDQAEPQILMNPCIRWIQSAFFPFDRPSIMHRAVNHIKPMLMVLLETEIWPGHIRALKKRGTPIVIINGRLSAKSLRYYRHWPSLRNRLAPSRILAMSAVDTQRFATLFGRDRVEVISNLKFDRLDFQTQTVPSSNPLNQLFVPKAKILVLGSVRQEEEDLVCKMIHRIWRVKPQTIICIFPRHEHRLHTWSSLLNKHHFGWVLRSRIEKSVTPGSIILWDTYGELVYAYGLCQAAFVGGSLAPLGGQNFIEPMANGVLPVIGPHWDNFAWVGEEVISDGLVRIASDWKQAADRLIDILSKPPKREIFRKKALDYVKARQGGMASACQLIEQYVDDSSSN